MLKKLSIPVQNSV